MHSVAKKRRIRIPELERGFHRDSKFGYEPEGSFGFVRYLEHGAPNSLIRWHYHAEYELHFIVQTSGKIFVGDYIGRFEPGQLVLTGPRLPHNWISSDMPEGGVKLRDRALQFAEQPLLDAAAVIPELKEALALLKRAHHGIEFMGLRQQATQSLDKIKASTGLQRLSEFLKLMDQLARHEDYQLLSSAKLQSFEDDASLKQISEVIEFITNNYAEPLNMAHIAESINMGESCFSRYFKRATGNTFTHFVNQLRISRACQLIMETDQYINTICYSVGFNNVANFNRRFKDIKGMAPNEFRRNAEARYG